MDPALKTSPSPPSMPSISEKAVSRKAQVEGLTQVVEEAFPAKEFSGNSHSLSNFRKVTGKGVEWWTV